MQKKWCGSCGKSDLYEEHASYCIYCGERSLDYRCKCSRLHAGGMPCHCEPVYINKNQRIIHDTQYDTIHLRKGK